MERFGVKVRIVCCPRIRRVLARWFYAARPAAAAAAAPRSFLDVPSRGATTCGGGGHGVGVISAGSVSHTSTGTGTPDGSETDFRCERSKKHVRISWVGSTYVDVLLRQLDPFSLRSASLVALHAHEISQDERQRQATATWF